MKTHFFTLAAIILTITTSNIFAQTTVSAIKSECKMVDGRMSNEQYKQDIEQFKRIRSILNVDVIEYYNLKDQYDTELKQKVYKNTEDYKLKLAELQKLKAELISTNYYLDFEPTYYERNNIIKYDLTTKTFTVTNEINPNSNYNKPAFVQFDQIVFKCPQGFSVKQKQRQIDTEGDYTINQNISFKIDKEELAVKIEENRSNLKILFVFNYTQTSSFKNNVLGLAIYTDYYLLTKIQNVIIYNNSTGEIYAEFKPLIPQNIVNKGK